MEWDDSIETYLLSTGTKIPAHEGVLGLARNGSIFGVWDAGVWEAGTIDYLFQPLTDQERREVADYIADRWQKWARQEQ